MNIVRINLAQNIFLRLGVGRFFIRGELSKCVYKFLHQIEFELFTSTVNEIQDLNLNEISPCFMIHQQTPCPCGTFASPSMSAVA